MILIFWILNKIQYSEIQSPLFSRTIDIHTYIHVFVCTPWRPHISALLAVSAWDAIEYFPCTSGNLQQLFAMRLEANNLLYTKTHFSYTKSVNITIYTIVLTYLLRYTHCRHLTKYEHLLISLRLFTYIYIDMLLS